jgi:DNA-binding transcriptional ArsR family regulator
MSLEDLVIERSKRCEMFANPLRSLIALLIFVKGEVIWSDLKSSLKKFIGNDINPNTLSFHIGKLIDAGFLEKVDIEGQPLYKITEGKVHEMEEIVGKDLIEKTKEAILT